MANVDDVGIVMYICIYIYIHTYLSRIYVHIDDMGYMTNPMDLCWFMKLITHVAINWGCIVPKKCVNSKKMDVIRQLRKTRD